MNDDLDRPTVTAEYHVGWRNGRYVVERRFAGGYKQVGRWRTLAGVYKGVAEREQNLANADRHDRIARVRVFNFKPGDSEARDETLSSKDIASQPRGRS